MNLVHRALIILMAILSTASVMWTMNIFSFSLYSCIGSIVFRHNFKIIYKWISWFEAYSSVVAKKIDLVSPYIINYT